MASNAVDGEVGRGEDGDVEEQLLSPRDQRHRKLEAARAEKEKEDIEGGNEEHGEGVSGEEGGAFEEEDDEDEDGRERWGAAYF